jgi:hypothetical protein
MSSSSSLLHDSPDPQAHAARLIHAGGARDLHQVRISAADRVAVTSALDTAAEHKWDLSSCSDEFDAVARRISPVRFTDAEVAAEFVGTVLADRYVNKTGCVNGIGWLKRDGEHWVKTHLIHVTEEARAWVVAMERQTRCAGITNPWDRYQSLGKLNAIVRLARDVVAADTIPSQAGGNR